MGSIQQQKLKIKENRISRLLFFVLAVILYNVTGRTQPSSTLNDLPPELYLTDSLYKILGMISERNIELPGNDRHRVKKAKPKPLAYFRTHDEWKADHFEQLLWDFRAESGYDFDYKRAAHDDPRAKVVFFYSEKLRELLDGLSTPMPYVKTLDRDKLFGTASREELIAYIESAHLVHGIQCKNHLRASFAFYKMETIAYALNAAGIRDVHLRHIEALGGGSELTFSPNEELQTLLGISEFVSMVDLENQREQLFLRMKERHGEQPVCERPVSHSVLAISRESMRAARIGIDRTKKIQIDGSKSECFKKHDLFCYGSNALCGSMDTDGGKDCPGGIRLSRLSGESLYVCPESTEQFSLMLEAHKERKFLGLIPTSKKIHWAAKNLSAYNAKRVIEAFFMKQSGELADWAEQKIESGT